MIATIGFNFGALISASVIIYVIVGSCAFFLRSISELSKPWSTRTKLSFSVGLQLSLPLGISAVVLGFLSGLSFEPSISSLITGLVSLISGSAIYIFGKDRAFILPVSLAILVFSLNLLAGTTLGSEVRDRALYNASVLARNRLLNDAISTSIIEFRVKTFRENLGLDPNMSHLGISNPPNMLSSPKNKDNKESK